MIVDGIKYEPPRSRNIRSSDPSADDYVADHCIQT